MLRQFFHDVVGWGEEGGGWREEEVVGWGVETGEEEVVGWGVEEVLGWGVEGGGWTEVSAMNDRVVKNIIAFYVY